MWIKIKEVIVNLDNVCTIKKEEYGHRFFLLLKFYNTIERSFEFNKESELNDKFNKLNKMISEYYDCENQLKEL